MTERARVPEKPAWHDALLRALKAWNRHQIPKILTAVVVIWIVSGTALHFVEGGTDAGVRDVARVPLACLGHPLQRPRRSPPDRWRAAHRVRRAYCRCRPGGLVHCQRRIHPDRTLTEESRSDQSRNVRPSGAAYWSPRALDFIREVHSGIVNDTRPVVIVHDQPDEVVLPDKQDEPPSTTSTSSRATRPTKLSCAAPRSRKRIPSSSWRMTGKATTPTARPSSAASPSRASARKSASRTSSPSARIRSTGSTCASRVPTKSSRPPTSGCG